MAYMKPLGEDQLKPYQGLFDAMVEKMGFVPNSLKTLARKPKLLNAFVTLALESSTDDTVDTRLKYLVGLIASQTSGCLYCQAHLSVTSSREGIFDEKIAQLWLFEQSELYTEAERSALRYARDASQQPNQVTAEHYRDLHCHYSEEQVVEILAIICLFRWLNCWNDTMATELEALPLSKAEALFSEQGWNVGKHSE